MSFVVRPFEPDDAEWLLAAHQAAILAAEPYSRAVRESWAHGLTAEGYRQVYRSRERCVVGVAGGRAVGFCSFAGDTICGLYVHPDHQGMGLGRALLAAAESDLAEQGATSLRVQASLTARPFYARMDYAAAEPVEIATRGGLPLAAMRMEKRLGNGA